MAPTAECRDPQLTTVGDCRHTVPREGSFKPLLEIYLTAQGQRAFKPQFYEKKVEVDFIIILHEVLPHNSADLVMAFSEAELFVKRTVTRPMQLTDPGNKASHLLSE